MYFSVDYQRKKQAIIHTENQIALIINALRHWSWHRPARSPYELSGCAVPG